MSDENLTVSTPRDAASMVLFRGPVEGPEVLMGRRRDDLRFMPGYYVFPGGTVDDTDREIARALTLHPATRDNLLRHAPPGLVPALAWAAIRETWEETNGLYGVTGDWRVTGGICAAADAFLAQRLAPLAGQLDFIARAVTPKKNPIRFDTRFFLADAAYLTGDVRSMGELEEVAWVRADFAVATLPMASITRFVMARGLALWAQTATRGGGHEPCERAIPRFTQSGGRYAMVEDAPGDAPVIDPDKVDW